MPPASNAGFGWPAAAAVDRRAGQLQVQERRAIFDAVMEGRASSRGEIARLFAMRSSTVSDHVGQLIASGLLVEHAGRTTGRGRPPSILVANPHALAVAVFQVVSQSIRTTVLDLAGNAMSTQTREVPVDCDNGMMHEVLSTSLGRALHEVPRGTTVTGAAFSLSGVLDVSSRKWLFSSRWPKLMGLDVGAAAKGRGLDILVTRNLDAELRARLARAGAADGGTLILHWGYGIGAAYAIDGVLVNDGEGRFGEVGHWRLNRASGNRCRCGRQGCLETLASLWALHPILERIWPGIAVDERKFAEQARTLDLLSVPAFGEALDAIATGIANLCRILFPRRIIISGPFIANSAVWAALNARFREEGVLVHVETPELIGDQRSEELELEGAGRPLLERALARRLAGLEERGQASADDPEAPRGN